MQEGALRASFGLAGVAILAASVTGASAFTLVAKDGARSYMQWTRHLTNWNAILTSLWLLVAAQQPPARPSAAMLGFGYAVVLLNLFVFFVRWGWFRISSLWRSPSHLFGDVVIHALVPIIAGASFLLATRRAPIKDHRTPVIVGIVFFWIIIVLWYIINLVLVKMDVVKWPYPNGAGRDVPRDIYPDRTSSRAFLVYIGLNAIAALSISALAIVFVYARGP